MPDADSVAIVLCEPAKSKHTWTCHKSHFVWNLKENAGPQSRDTRFVRDCAAETHMDTSQQPFCIWKVTGKMSDADSAAIVLCEPAQSKCAWTLHNSHFE